MFKKVLSFGLSMIMMLSLLSVAAFADEVGVVGEDNVVIVTEDNIVNEDSTEIATEEDVIEEESKEDIEAVEEEHKDVDDTVDEILRNDSTEVVTEDEDEVVPIKEDVIKDDGQTDDHELNIRKSPTKANANTDDDDGYIDGWYTFSRDGESYGYNSYLDLNLSASGNGYKVASRVYDVTIPSSGRLKLSVKSSELFFMVLMVNDSSTGERIFVKSIYDAQGLDDTITTDMLPKGEYEVTFSIIAAFADIDVMGEEGYLYEISRQPGKKYFDHEIIWLKSAIVQPKSVSLNKTSATLDMGKTLQLNATISPSNATNKAVSWKSSNTSVATVDSKGKVATKKAGTATITVTTKDGNKTATCKITVKAKTATAISFDKNAYDVGVKKTIATKLKISPAGAKADVTYTSANKSIATVSADGKITGVKIGTTTITVKSKKNAKVTGKVKVRVWFNDVMPANVPSKMSKASFQYIYWGANNGIINGYSDGSFKPNANLSRANFCIMLWKMAGKPAVPKGAQSFNDIGKLTANGQKAIRWAQAIGLVNGVGKGKFDSNATLTRSQIMIILWKWSGRPSPGKTKNFTDIGKLTKNNKTAVQWGINKGIITASGSKFNPNGKVTRGQFVDILYKYNKAINNKSYKKLPTTLITVP